MDEEQTVSQAPPEKPAGGKAGFILTLLALTVLSALAGGAFALIQTERIEQVANQRANEPPPKVDDALVWDEDSAVTALEPIVSNLARPANVWIRLDASVLFDKGEVSDVERLRAEVSQSVLAFLRTLTLGELTGASAFAHLRDDLNERVRLSTKDAVKDVILTGMVIQ